MQEQKEDTIMFVEDLLNRLKNGTLTLLEQRRLTQFYLTERYIKERNDDDDDDREKHLKYLTLGWYIYENLLIK